MSLQFETMLESGGGPLQSNLSSEPSVAGRRLGRYVLVELLGRGGMGVVYRAYDPELDRIVAIKLVLEGGSEALQLRLQREAQVIAKLSHPNVVQVFDVGRVDADGAVFIAMEHVAGMTLRAWLKQEERSWEQILEVFTQAGEGLQAAHEHDLIHRDFKPENVLVDRSGRPRVLDFGLAKAGTDSTLDSPLQRRFPASLSVSSLPSDSALTRDGAQIGTPAYMSPEQHTGLDVDGRADQFSFAVALWEALFHQLPFAGSRAESYAIAVLDGERRDPPRDAAVPRHVIAVLERGLSVEAADRYPDMRAMIAALRADPAGQRRRRIWGLSVGLGLGLSLGVAGVALSRDHQRAAAAQADPCVEAGRRITGVWGPNRRARIEGAVAGVDRPFAASTATRVGTELDALAHGWSTLAVEQCRRDTSEPLFQARATCLDGLHVRIDRLASALEQPSRSTLEHAVGAVASLDSALDECRDPSALEARARALQLEDDPLIAEVAALLIQADDALALGELGVAAKLDARIPQPPAEGGWPTALVLDRARFKAQLDKSNDGFEAARARLLDAAQLVVGAPSAPLAAAEFQAQLAGIAWELGDLDGLELGLARALRLTETARGTDHPATHFARAATGHVAFARGDYLTAVDIYRRADEALATTLRDDDLDRLTLAGWIAEGLDGMSRHAQAIAALHDLHLRYAGIYGEGHPLTLDRLESLGRSRLRAGDHEGALVDFETTLAGLREDPSWRDALHEAVLLGNIGAALTAAERWDDAELRLLEALDRLPGVDPETTMHQTALEANLAIIRNAKGDHAGARSVLEACTERVDAQGSDASHNGVMIRLELSRTLLELGEFAAALTRAGEALDRAEGSGSKVLVARSELRRAQALDELGRRRHADLALRRAREALEGETGAETWIESIETYARMRDG